MRDAQLVGAYGLRILGVDNVDNVLQQVPAGWETLRVEQQIRASTGNGIRWRIRPDQAELLVGGGPEIVLDRLASSVVITSSSPLPDAGLIHPYLAFPAAVANHWAGRCSLHAGAIVVDGRAWALVGIKEGGKSSTLGWLAQQGHSVLTDDLLVVDRGRAFAGPRCVDLREETARWLGMGTPLGVIGSRPRFRVMLGPVPVSVPLAGWIFLSWASDVQTEVVRPGALLKGLFTHHALSVVPANLSAYLDLVALPAWSIQRPRRLEFLPAVGRHIVRLIQERAHTRDDPGAPTYQTSQTSARAGQAKRTATS